MKRKLLLSFIFLCTACFAAAQPVGFFKGMGEAVLRQNIEKSLLVQTQRAAGMSIFAGATHSPLYNPATNSFSFIPRVTASTPYDIARLEVAEQAHWDRISLARQREFARLSQVPARLSEQISPSLVQIYLKNRDDMFVANGFIINHNGQNWVALSYHVGGRLLNERVVKMKLKDNTEVSFTGIVGKAGNAGYHEIDISLILIPQEYQNLVTPLEIGTLHEDQPLYSFGSVATDSGHDDFIPVKRTLLKHDGYSLQMTHHMPGDDPMDPSSISGYCGSPIVQEIDGRLQVVGIYTGHVNPVSADYPAISYAIDIAAVPLLIDGFFPSRTVKFFGQNVFTLFFNERLENMALWRNGELIVERSLYHFPNEFTPEQAEKAFFDQRLQSGDLIKFTVNRKHETSLFEYVIP